jgi:L-iditol 2-dehydrogenase
VLGVAKTAPGTGNVNLIDVPEPAVLPGHVVIEVQAAGICGTDLHIYHDEFPSVPPVIMGHEVAGVIADTGQGVSRVRVGDRVTTETYFSVCNECLSCRSGHPNLCLQRKSIGSAVNGGFTKYLLVPERNIHALPLSVDEFSGALTEPLACCVHALELTRIEPGEIAVVSGPGTIGLLTLQLVKAAGARVIVLGTDADEERLALARRLGADFTVNVNSADFRKVILDETEDQGADIVFECAGSAASAHNCLSVVRRRGCYTQVGLFGKPILWDLEQICYKELKVSGSNATVPTSWRKALNLMASGQVKTAPLISEVMPITEWRRAFEGFERKQGLKRILTPQR